MSCLARHNLRFERTEPNDFRLTFPENCLRVSLSLNVQQKRRADLGDLNLGLGDLDLGDLNLGLGEKVPRSGSSHATTAITGTPTRVTSTSATFSP